MTNALALVPSQIIKIKNRSLATRGFTKHALKEHLQEHLRKPSEQWCSMQCAARTMFGRDTQANRQKMRARVRVEFRYLLDRGSLLAIDYESQGNGHHGEIKAMKIHEPSSDSNVERQCIEVQLRRMRDRKSISEDQYNRAIELIALPETPAV